MKKTATLQVEHFIIFTIKIEAINGILLCIHGTYFTKIDKREEKLLSILIQVTSSAY